jgi:hypothetical protein
LLLFYRDRSPSIPRDDFDVLFEETDLNNEVEIDLTQRLHHSGVPYQSEKGSKEEEDVIPAWTRSSPADIYFEMAEVIFMSFLNIS